eukprot:TRINITY_DN7354_c1_g1_i5.p1 TRINITY_DN7354_c1_g1~~TRINITY_DN7354_c1_g1_i5.p1  ORF type:complete len:262 (+),score=49.83 TRINITY_DN7354_c1_g1_i5:181-966(+)
MPSVATIADILRRDDRVSISRETLEGWREDSVWSPQQFFKAALAVEAVDIMSGLLGYLKMVGRIIEVLGMQDIACTQESENADTTIKNSRVQFQRTIQRRNEASQALRDALNAEMPDVDRLESDSSEIRLPTTTNIERVFATELAELGRAFTGGLDAGCAGAGRPPYPNGACDDGHKGLQDRRIEASCVYVTVALVEAQRRLVADEKRDDMLLYEVDIVKEAATCVSSSPSVPKLDERAWQTLWTLTAPQFSFGSSPRQNK